jgi:hypothetical protein
MAGVAALLMYAGFRGTDPLSALREVATGKPKGLAEQSAAREALYTGVGVEGGGSAGGSSGVSQAGLSGGTHPEFAQAAGRFANDRYSQARRWQSGYSDCSSFVGKALKACGVAPPGGSVTGSYLVWRSCVTIPRSQVGAGDFLVGPGHMAIALSSSMAIGQQNARQNVQVSGIDQIMYGQPSWIARRYTGKSRAGATQA